MEYVETTLDGSIATLTLSRGKVNALDTAMVGAIHDAFRAVEREDAVRAVILTGCGSFFSFGFDIPGFMSHPEDEFRLYLTRFTDLYTYLYGFPKPVVAALNGHTIAGGCMIAIACDDRLMVTGKAKISLNEITFGSSVFAGSVEMLCHLVGQRNAETVLLSGAMYGAEEARQLGLVDEVVSPDELAARATAVAREHGDREGPAFRSIKTLLRRPVLQRMIEREAESIREFSEIWYSAATRARLAKITIRS
jgi:Delta3-Delta2-enoyl-CoA isomerase